MPSQLGCTERLSAVVPPDLKRLTDRAAASLGISTGSAVRIALIEWLEGLGHYSPPSERKAAR